MVFNTNAPLDTNSIFNTIDAGPPTSSVLALPAITFTPSFTVSWSGSDDPGGSGIATFDVFVSTDGGPFTPFQTATTATSATFNGAVGHTYGFYSIATDNVGNREAAKTVAEATTRVVDAFNNHRRDRGSSRCSLRPVFNFHSHRLGDRDGRARTDRHRAVPGRWHQLRHTRHPERCHGQQRPDRHLRAPGRIRSRPFIRATRTSRRAPPLL